MPEIKAFKGLYAEEKYKHNFAVCSVDRYTQEEIQKIEDCKDPSYLHIIASTLLNNTYSSDQKFRKVRKQYEKHCEKKIIIEEQNASLYVYEQSFPNKKTFTGFLGLLNLEEYQNGIIKKHESTLKERENLFTNYLNKVHVQAEPTLVTYTESSKLDLMMELEKKGIPILKMTDHFGITHKIWRVDNRLKIQQIREAFQAMDSLYIADGHHRMGSTYQYREFCKQENPEHIGNELYNYIFSYIIPAHDLQVLEYNRLISDLNGHTKESFLDALAKSFHIVPKGNVLYYPSKKFHISMYLEGEFYALYIDKEFRGSPEGLGELDTYLFEKLLLQPILNIQDSRIDPRIHYKKGTGNLEGIRNLKNAVDTENYKVGFGFFPLQFECIKLISDLGLTMPPKSTYIEPKLLSGLMMFRMK